MNCYKNIFFKNPIILLIITSLLLRTIAFLYIPHIPIRPDQYTFYPAVLLDHFWEYVLNNTVLPPFIHFIGFANLKIFGLKFAAENHTLILFVFLINILTVFFIYRTLQLLKVATPITLFLCYAYSIGSIGLELWASRQLYDGYDRYTPFLTSFFAFTIFNFLNRLTWKNVFFINISSSLLILQLSSAGYIVPMAICNLILILFIFKNKIYPTSVSGISLAKKSLVLLLSLCIPLGLLVVRNYQATGLISTSSKGGPAIMMFVLDTMGYGAQTEEYRSKGRHLIVEAKAPNWYLWCYDNFVNPIRIQQPNLQEAEYLGWDYLARSFGMCSMPMDQYDIPGKPWPFDFSKLKQYVDSVGAIEVSAALEKDIYDSYNKQYLSKGHGVEFASRWNTLYGLESIKIAKYYLKHYPLEYLKGIRRHHRDFYGGQGPDIILKFMGQLSGSGFVRDIESKNKVFIQIIRVCNQYILSKVFRISYYVTPFVILICLILVFTKRNSKINWITILMDTTPSLWICYMPVLFMSLLYSAVVSQENDRYFIHSMPYVVLCFGIIANALLRVWKNK